MLHDSMSQTHVRRTMYGILFPPVFMLVHLKAMKYRTIKRVIDKRHNIVLPFGDIIFYNEHQHKNRTYVSSFCLPNTQREIKNFEEVFLERLRATYGRNKIRDNKPRDSKSRDSNPYKCFMK